MTVATILAASLMIAALWAISARFRERIEALDSVPMRIEIEGHPNWNAKPSTALLFTPILGTIILLAIASSELVWPQGSEALFATLATGGALIVFHAWHLGYALRQRSRTRDER